MQGRTLGSVDPIVFTAIGVTVSIPFAGALAFATPQHFDDPVRGLVLLAVLVVDCALAMACYAACVRRSGARAASILFALIPTVSVVVSWVLLHDRIDATIFVALTCGAFACLAQGRASRGAPAAQRAGVDRRPERAR